MRICFPLIRRVPGVPSPIALEAQRLLRRMGHEMTGWIPEDRLLRTDVLAPEADLCVLKSHTELALNYVGAFHEQGITVCNEYGVCLTAQDKVTTGRLVRELRVPTPGAWFTDNPQWAIGLLAEEPLIIRPRREHRGAGLHLIEEAAQLTSMQTPLGPLIVQRYVPSPREDLKVCVVGEDIQAIRKPFDPQSFTRFRRSAHVDEKIRDVAARIRSGFGLKLFGCGVIESPDSPKVVDINYLPGYKGCPDPAPVVTATIDRVTCGS